MSDYTAIAETVVFGSVLVGVAASIAWAYRAHVQATAESRKAFYGAQEKVIAARAAAVQALSQKFSQQELTDLLGKVDGEKHDPIGWLQKFNWET